MTASTNASSADLRLWDQAFSSLDETLRETLIATRTNKRNVLEAVLRENEAKRQLAARKRWKFKNSDGDVIIVRDVLEKIAKWVTEFKEFGDVAAQYVPTRLSLPWTPFRFLLQRAVSEVNVFGAMASDLEYIARIVVRYCKFERLYLQETKSEPASMLVMALTRLYKEILTYLAHTVTFLQENTTVRPLENPAPMIHNEQMRKIIIQEAEVLKIVKSADIDRLLGPDAAITRISIYADTCSKSLPEQDSVKILAWLSMSPSDSHHGYVSRSRISGFGGWLLNHNDYINWQTSSSSSLLWLHGVTGSGKSMLCSVVVDSFLKITDNNPLAAPFAYFYCASSDSERSRCLPDDIMRSLLGQLTIDVTDCCKMKELLSSEYERQDARSKVDGLDLSKLRIQDCVRLILELAEQDPLTIIIDAIDALEEDQQQILVSALKKITSEADNVIKILTTSRSNNSTIIAPLADKQIQITSLETRRDMESFVNHLIDTNVTSKQVLAGDTYPTLCQMLIQTLLDEAGERFLWARLQVERLRREGFESAVVKALQNKLPEDLDQLYQKSLDHILEAGTATRDIAVRAFSWMIYMRESLTPSALLAAISDTQNPTSQLTRLIEVCEGFIVLDEGSNAVRFAHESVKEFLERRDLFTAAKVHKRLASTCVRTCSRKPFPVGDLRSPIEDFHVYAATYWPVHSKMAEAAVVNDDAIAEIASFVFDDDLDTTLSFDSWLETKQNLVKVLANDHPLKPALDAIPDDDTSLLCLPSIFGLIDLLYISLKHMKNLDVNQFNTHGCTPVYLAATFGHSCAISMLVEYGGDVNIRCGKYGSPLHAACFAGHLEAVKTLLKLGANVSNGSTFRDALQAAYQGGQEDVALLLIEGGFTVKSEDKREEALKGAARAGFTNVFEQLHRPSFPLPNGGQLRKTREQLENAIEGGQVGIVRQLLGCENNRRESLPLEAIALATLYNHKALVEFLLDEGMSIEAEGPLGTPLRTACLLDYCPIARLLLDRGADVKACGVLGSALQAGAMKGHITIVQLVIDEGGDVNQQSGFYGTALQAAAYHGHHRIVELLVDAGADFRTHGYVKDALHAAAEGGHQDVVMLILQKGYEIRVPFPEAICCFGMPSPYKALMREASHRRSSDLNVTEQSQRASATEARATARPIVKFETIFRLASEKLETSSLETRENLAICHRSLLLSGKHARDGCYRQSRTRPLLLMRRCSKDDNCALEAAAAAGHEGVVKLLLKLREVLGISEFEIACAFEAAASNSRRSVFESLLDFAAKNWSINFYVKSIFEVANQNQRSQIIDFVLTWAAEHCSLDEILELKQHLVMVADKYFHDLDVSHETLVSDFEDACETGDIQVIDAILQSKHHKVLSSHEIEAGLQLCAQNNQVAVARILLQFPLIKGRLPASGKELFVTAAGGGYVAAMQLFASFWTNELITAGSLAITHALVVASENGHFDVVQHLIQNMSANVNNLALDKALRPGPYHHPPVSHRLAQLFPKPFVWWNPTKAPFIAPLSAALRGYATFGPLVNDLIFTGNTKHFEQARLITFLIDIGSNLNDPGGLKASPLQLAAEFCSVHVVEKLISEGADIKAIKDEEILLVAVGRELSGASVLRVLLAAGVTIPQQIEKQKELLEKALCYFEGNTSSRFSKVGDDPDGRFVLAPSLEYVFKEGPGAVLFELLRHMPHIMTTDIRWGLVLQIAALLGNCSFISLLLSHGVNVNSVGYYYGTALEAAARGGNNDIIQKLIDAGAEVNVLSGRWQTALRAAIVGSHREIVEALLTHGADLNLRDMTQPYQHNSEGLPETALQLAIRYSDLGIVKVLLEHGADAAYDEPETLHPLILASAIGNSAVVRELLDAGAPVNVRGKKRPAWAHIHNEDASPIHAAIAGSHLDVVKLLLSRGSEVEHSVEGSATPLDLAIKQGTIEIVQELLTAGSKAEPTFALACRQRHVGAVELLLEVICDGGRLMTVVQKAFATQGLDSSLLQLLLEYVPFTMADFIHVCAVGTVESVRVMLDKGEIDVNGQDEMNDDHPLQVAASRLQVGVVQLLLSRGADPNYKSTKRGTPLTTALEASVAPALYALPSDNAIKLKHEVFRDESGYHARPRAFCLVRKSNRPSFQDLSDCEEIVQLLVSYGANIVDNSSAFGPSLHLACLLGSNILVEMFLDKGADLGATAGYFQKAIFAAVLGGRSEIVALLLQRSPLTTHIHPEYSTPLHLACALDSSDIVCILLEHGADATVLDSQGLTPLTIALQGRRNAMQTHWRMVLRLADSVLVREEDLMAASKMCREDAREALTSLLDADKSIGVSETVMCSALRQFSAWDDVLELLVQRSGDIGITPRMLEAAQNHVVRKLLLKHRRKGKATPYVLAMEKTFKHIPFLPSRRSSIPVTEKVKLLAPEIEDDLGNERQELTL